MKGFTKSGPKKDAACLREILPLLGMDDAEWRVGPGSNERDKVFDGILVASHP